MRPTLVQRCFLASIPRTPHERFLPRPTAMVFLIMWSLFGLSQPVIKAEPTGFSQQCTAFAEDPWLQQFVSEAALAGLQKRSAAFAPMVPRLTLQGSALATYEVRRDGQPLATLEAVFGVSQGAQRVMTETSFSQDARGVMLYPQILATVAHALTPELVEVFVAQQQRKVQTVPLRVTESTVEARATPEAMGILSQVTHLNIPYDLALVLADANPALQPFPYPAVLSYGTGDSERPSGGLQAGDCVAALVTDRDARNQDTGADRLVIGKVLAKVPVATNNMTQTKLNVNMFTTDLPVQPGDSGSPVLAIRDGHPVLIGLVSATMYPTALFTYVTRLDPLLALADALRTASLFRTPPRLMHSQESLRPQ